MQTIDLSGEWTLQQSGKKEAIKATMPGCVHTDHNPENTKEAEEKFKEINEAYTEENFKS